MLRFVFLHLQDLYRKQNGSTNLCEPTRVGILSWYLSGPEGKCRGPLRVARHSVHLKDVFMRDYLNGFSLMLSLAVSKYFLRFMCYRNKNRNLRRF